MPTTVVPAISLNPRDSDRNLRVVR